MSECNMPNGTDEATIEQCLMELCFKMDKISETLKALGWIKQNPWRKVSDGLPEDGIYDAHYNGKVYHDVEYDAKKDIWDYLTFSYHNPVPDCYRIPDEPPPLPKED